MLHYPDGNCFVKSRTSYLDTIEGHPGNRICIPVQFAGLPKTLAVVDTGAPWCVLSKEEATTFDPNYRNEGTNEITLNIRSHEIEGVLVRWNITLCAEEGVDMTVDATVFVPDDDILIPNFIGLDGLLTRIRFAVDPKSNHFFFGSM